MTIEVGTKGIYHALLSNEVMLVKVASLGPGATVNLESDSGYIANNIPVVEKIDITTSTRWFYEGTKKDYTDAVRDSKALAEEGELEEDFETEPDEGQDKTL